MPISIIPLGAGQDVGRSCILVKIGSKVIMFDCGMHMGYKDERKYPDFSLISAQLNPTIINSIVDLVIISHYHLDHCGALPYFTEKIGYSGPVIMTYPTKSVSSVLLTDYSKIMEQKLLIQRSNSNSRICNTENFNICEYGFFSIGDVWSCMEKISTIQLHQTLEISGVEITPYYAGHVLGASMFHVKVGDETVVYSGDYNMVRDRHLGPAVLPRLSPSLLLSESTYATYVRPSRRSTERIFCELVLSCLKKGGKVLIPVFAIGRAQELCILLEIFWRRMQLRYPIYFGGSMTEKANSYYQLFINWTNTPLIDNIFSFPHVMQYDKTLLNTPGPAVLFATPGMLHTGLSLHAFRLWAPDPNNLTIIPGFCVPGTIGSKIISGIKKVFIDQKDPSTCIDVNCTVKYLSFSSHADSIGIQSLISHVEPQSIAFIHGERQGMLSLASFVNSSLKIPAFCPHNGSFVTIPTDKYAKYSSHLYCDSSFLMLKLSDTCYLNYSKYKSLTLDTIYSDIEFFDIKINSRRIISRIINEAGPSCVFVYVFKEDNKFFSFLLTKSQLYFFIVRLHIHFCLKFLNLVSELSVFAGEIQGKEYIFPQKKNPFLEPLLFKLYFSLELEIIRLFDLFTAIENLRRSICGRNCYSFFEDKIQAFDLEVNFINPKQEFSVIQYCLSDESIMITYKSLTIYFKSNESEQQIFKDLLSGNLEKDKKNINNTEIKNIQVLWSYIDSGDIEISNFVKYVENL
ncbi:CPSF metallobeta-lactamase [Cryptosporidium ryanae]|uniref:CPSF metallobeta-lactamase n=1 Tax=Cryptosporidium ryanae TaxID=515981 RepID=UPI00351A51A2|nr:CPSF metallobeta-lactamase [Cryptosporidium ryanae]